MPAPATLPNDINEACATWTPDGFTARAWHALDMALQPIVNMRSGGVYGYEALMRGHGQLGLGSIAEVLDMAHRLHVADRLHLILLEKSLRKLVSLGELGERKLFFNLDGRALQGTAVLHEETFALLQKYAVAPSALCLEFSETFDYASAVDVAEMVAEHRERGVRFAIDDFGRGFSELKVLYEHHPEFIKIDRFFVTGMVTDSRKRLFVTNIVNLAHVLGIRIVVEGIETEREYEQCWRIGCDLAQGYFVAPPRLTFPEGHVTCPHLRLSAQRNQRGAEDGSGVVCDRIERLAPVPEGASMSEVFEAFRFSHDKTVVPVLDASGEAKGIIREQDLKEFTYSPYGRDLLANSSCRRSLSDFIRHCPIADINTSAESILDVYAYHENSDGIIITENSRYAGFLSAQSLLEIINDRRLEAARDQNPLSKLPGNISITRYSEVLVENAEFDRYLCYMDFDNFKPFNDTYSFREGDRAIMMFADLLRHEFSDSRYMIGHVGGDDFFVGGFGMAERDVTRSLKLLRERFAKSVESLYSTEDRERGFIEARDRYGKRRRFPLLTCSIAMMKIPAGKPAECIEAVLYEIARLKRKAKKSDSGLARAECGDARPFKAGVDRSADAA